ncbi:MAG: polyphenol oxidase family protein [Gemmatimonadota bacterium]
MDCDVLIAAYTDLAVDTGFDSVAVPRQIHGHDVDVVVRGKMPRHSRVRVLLPGRLDGLVTADAGVLLASTAADCVPIYLLDSEARLLGLLHAGWRGVAGNILDRGIEALQRLGAARGRVRIHLGPAICGRCYEVDAPVLGRFGSPAERALLDLRGALIAQALDAGLNDANVTVSTHCTSCGPANLHSHRASAGEAGRMAAFMGFRGPNTGV